MLYDTVYDEFEEPFDDEQIVDEYGGYVLIQTPDEKNSKKYICTVLGPTGETIKTWKSAENLFKLSARDYLTSIDASIFYSSINHKSKRSTYASKNQVTFFDDYDEYPTYIYNSNKPYGNASKNYQSWEPKRNSKMSNEDLDKLKTSNTLVIHCKDNSTKMLAQVYEGKNWDIITDGNINKEDLHELINCHDRIVCLGHGTSAGLLNVQAGGYIIGSEEAPLLKNKNIFAIWCYATKYFSNHDIGHGMFITKNVPSEVWEAAAVGFKVSARYILENITYWSKCCADVADQALSGDVAGAVKKARAAYQAKYGNDSNPDQKGVTDYNTDAIQIQP